MQVLCIFLDKICKLLTYHTPFYCQPLQSYQRSKIVHILAHPVFVVADVLTYCCYCVCFIEKMQSY